MLVDEFQDTNRVQLDLIEQLRGPETRLFCVGDEHQSIYRFRNADLAVFRERARARASRTPAPRCWPCAGTSARRPAPLAAIDATGSGLLERFTPLTWGRPTPDDGRPAGSVELLLTQDERSGDAPRWNDEGDRARASRLRRRSPPRSPRRASSPSACARWSTPARPSAATSSSCCAPSPTSTPTRRRSRGRDSTPTWSAAAATGRSSRSRTSSACSAASRTRSTTSALLGALASPAVGVSPDALWLLRQVAGPNSHIWPVIDWRYGDGTRAPWNPNLEWLDHVPARRRANARALLLDPRPAASRRRRCSRWRG